LQQFNGTWDQYIDAFRTGFQAARLVLVYEHAISALDPITPFKDYIRANQIDTDYYYNATPGAAQRDNQSALRIRRAILALPGSIRP